MNERSSHSVPSRAVSRAVRRSRAVRASFKRRRRRAFLIATCAAAALGIPLAWSVAADPAAEMVAAAVQQAQDLAELMSQRSPGARTAAELTKTKHTRAAARLRTQPGGARPAGHAVPPIAETPTDLATILQSPAVPVGLTAPGGSSPLTPPPTLGAIFAAAPGAGLTTPGQNSGPATYPTAQPREAVPSAVPEPGTWAMMLTGFGLIGWRLRRRRTRETLTA